MNPIYYLYYRWSPMFKFEFMVVKAESPEAQEVTYSVPKRKYHLSLEQWKRAKGNLLKRGFKRLPMQHLCR